VGGTAVRIEGLSKPYNGVDALKGLDLHVSERSIFGPSRTQSTLG
jgi:ABC-type sugar transport system ATPase subunit